MKLITPVAPRPSEVFPFIIPCVQLHQGPQRSSEETCEAEHDVRAQNRIKNQQCRMNDDAELSCNRLDVLIRCRSTGDSSSADDRAEVFAIVDKILIEKW